MSFSLSYVLSVTAVTLNYIDEVFCVAGQVRFYGERFTSGKEGICSESVRNVGTSGAIFATTEETRRKLGVSRIRGEPSTILPFSSSKYFSSW